MLLLPFLHWERTNDALTFFQSHEHQLSTMAFIFHFLSFV
jgi:hypothetical protein